MNEWTMIERKALDRDNCWQINLRHPESGRRLTVIINDDEIWVYNPANVHPPQQKETEND